MTEFWNSANINSAAIHILQSTVFVALVWLLTLAMRNYPARVRFSLWMAGSVKFLLPFALLISLGTHSAQTNRSPLEPTKLYSAIREISQPFATDSHPTDKVSATAHRVPDLSRLFTLIAGVWFCGSLLTLARLTRQWWSARRLVMEATTISDGREVNALRRTEARTRIRKPIAIVGICKGVEPGVFGVMRPVLIWPIGLSERLDDANLRAIMVHEVEHVRRLDNLTAAIHSLVEVIFWFHPVVWWIGAKMIEERERACDEMVLQENVEPQMYADSVLKVCAFCLESPLPYIAGVSGSDLSKRVLRITRYQRGMAVSTGRMTLLIAAALLCLTLPVGFGILRGQSLAVDSSTQNPKSTNDELQFDVVSIKSTPSSGDKTLYQYFPDETSFRGATVRMVLETAFGVDDNHIIDAPEWVNTNRYDIEAKVAPEDAPRLDKLKGGERGDMLIPVLVERMHLQYHHERRARSIYALVIAKGGPKLTKGEPAPPPGWKPAKDTPPDKEHYKVMTVPGHIEADSIPMFVLADQLTRLHALGRTVIDKTGLTANYTFTLRWEPETLPFPLMKEEGLGGATQPSTDGPNASQFSLFTAIQEQLGLKLVSQKSEDDVIVIDHIDQPTTN